MTVAELESIIRYHQDKYYNDQPEISDEEFDLLWDELSERAPQSELFSRVGSDASRLFSKRRHVMPMNSQEKASTPDTFLAWARKVNHPRYLVQYKLDGASLELQYQNGRLAHAVTRGNGEVGDDITANAVKMEGVVSLVSKGFNGAVRGEVIMKHAVHRQYFSEKANCRNAANGLMRRKDGAGSEFLTVLVYDAFRDEPPFEKETAKLDWLKKNGFETVETRIFSDPEEVVAYRETIAAQRASLGFDIDGLVVKGIEIDWTDLSRARPQKQIAFKFSRQEALTRLVDVEWSESGHLYTPVAIVEPVSVAGTTVQRASLVHPDLIATLGLKIGAEVVISKRGDIIPKIESVVHVPEEARPIEPPTTCSTCGAAVQNDGNRVYCTNRDCPRRAFHRIQTWVSVHEIRDVGDVLLRKLFDSGRVRKIVDLYRLTSEDLVHFEGVGEKSARKVRANVHATHHDSLPRFVAGFDLDGVGELTVQKLEDGGIRTLEELFGASEEQLAEIKGVGPIKADVIRGGIESVRGEMEELIGSGLVTIAKREIDGDSAENKPLAGLNFCFTGALKRAKRSEAEQIVRQLGGESRTSVSRGLDYLVTNTPESGSSKNQRASELGVSIIDEYAFWEMVDGPAP